MRILDSSVNGDNNTIINNYNHKNSNDELERLYQIYLQVQSGDKAALSELFQQSNKNQINKADELKKEYRFSHMDNILDSELVWEQERRRQEEVWTSSNDSKITFSFLCLNQMLYDKKKELLSNAKNTGYQDGKKKKSGHSKFYEGTYDISDFNELMYETIIEIFTTKTDENHSLTLDNKKSNTPICDGSSLLKNISYFTSRKINKRAATSYLDISDIGYFYQEDSAYEEEKDVFSYFDEYAKKEYLELNSSTSRFSIYSEYLEWLKRNDIFHLFKANSCEIKAIIETIMKEENVFLSKEDSGIQGMRFISQRALQVMIQFRHHIFIETSNLSKDMKLIEQRLLDHLFYSLNYKIGKARETEYKKESERFLYELDKKSYIKIFNKSTYEIYDKSIRFLNHMDFNKYSNLLKRQEDKILSILSLSKGKKKYDMLNLILENYDLVEDRKETMRNIAETILSYYQKEEVEYQKNELKNYKIKSCFDWEKAYWEAELEETILKIRLWSSKNVKHPILNRIKRENVMIYCGCVNFYFCDIEKEMCYKFPKNRRIINHIK